MLDCLIIGGGPGGMVAATYLKRFHRDVVIVDEGQSRTAWIPRSHNVPGFPKGISGSRMLRRMRDHALRMKVPVHCDRIVSLHRTGDVFHAQGNEGVWQARTVLMATGIVDRMPPLQDLHRAIRRGVVRLCPVCDGYEVTGRRIAIYGENYRDLQTHARFLRTFSPYVLIVVNGEFPAIPTESSGNQDGLDSMHAPTSITFGPHSCRITDASRPVEVDVLYIAYGADVQSSLAERLGAATDEDDNLLVDEHMQTCVDGLYAVGDVVSGLNQISTAAGQAAIAATAIHNRLPPDLMPAA